MRQTCEIAIDDEACGQPAVDYVEWTILGGTMRVYLCAHCYDLVKLGYDYGVSHDDYA